MGLFRYVKGNKSNDKQTIKEMISSIELEEFQKVYLEKRIPDVLNDDFDIIAIKNKVAFQIFRLIALISGILIPVFANFDDYFMLFQIDKNLWITILGITSALSFGFLQTFQNEKVWLHHREMYENLRTETFKFLSLSNKYKTSKTHKEAFSLFAEIVEETIKQDITNYTTFIEKREKNIKSNPS